jgi:5-hydroxyisourate hydrolase-like protein (transthyretin family)
MSDDQGYAIYDYTIPSDATLGIHIIRAELSGSPEYNDTTNINILGDELSIALEITPNRQLKGSTVELKATVLDNSSNPFPDVIIDFYDETSTENYWIHSTTTDNNGIAIYDWQIPQSRPVGVHTINATATIPLSEEILVDHATVEFLNPYTIELELSSTDINRGETVTLNATVTDSLSSTPEIGAEVKFYDNNTLIGTAITDDQGLASYDYIVPLDAIYGEHIINATVYEGDINFSEASESLTVYMNVTIDVTLSSSIITREDSITVSITLTDELGNGLVDYTVELYDATIDQVVASDVTDGIGYVELIYGIPLDSPIGPHDLIVRLVNTPQYVRFTEVQETLDVYASTDLHIDLQVMEADRGDIVEIIATLTDNLLNGLDGYTVLFYTGTTLLGSEVTNSSGIATFQWLVDNSVLGQQQIRAEFIASGYYHFSMSNTENLDIYSNPSLDLTLQLHARIGENVVIQALLTDENGLALEGYTIGFYLDDVLLGTAVTNISGIAAYTWIPDSAALYNVYAQFNETGYYHAAITQVEQIEVQTFYIDAPETVDRGDMVTLSATLTDSFGIGIEGEEVFFYLNGTLLGSSMTDSSGVATYDWAITNDLLGEQTLHVECPAFGYISTDVFTTVYSNTSLSILLSDSSVDRGDSVTITVTLSDENGALEGYDVVIYLNGEVLTTVTTNAQGIGEFIWTADELGNHIFYGNFTGFGYYYASLSGTTNVDVYTTPSLTLTTPTTGERGDVIKLVAELTDAGTPMEGYTIDFYINGQFLGSSITNSSAFATYDWTVTNDLLGDVSILAEFSGNGFYNPESDTNTITIYSNPSLTIEVTDEQGSPVTSVTQGDTVIFKATLLDEVGNPISGQSVLFYLNGTMVGSTITNAQGIAELQFTFTYELSEVQTVYADFEGFLYYYNCVSDTVQLSVYVDDMEIIVNIDDSYSLNEVFDLYIQVKDKDNPLFGVGNAVVQVYLNDVLIGEGITLTGIQAGDVTINCIIPSDAQIGAGIIKIVATKDDGQGVVRMSTVEHGTTIVDEPEEPQGTVIEILNDLTVEKGKDHTVKVKISKDGEPQVNINVKLYAEIDGNWELQDEDTTDVDGEVELKLRVQDELGSQKIKIVTDDKTKTETLKVKYTPDVDLDLDEGIELGDTLDIRVTIKDYDGEPIQVKVSIYFDGVLLISEKTDEDGSIHTTITPDEVGEYELKIKIDSIPDAIVETIEKTVRVGERLYIDVQENPDSTLTIIFQYANGTALSNTSVDFYIDGYGENNVNANSEYLQGFSEGDYYTTIQTDEYGVATFSMKEFDNGEYLIRLIFYRTDIKESVEIEIQATVAQQGGFNLPLIASLSDMSLLFSILTVIGVCGAISGLMYYFFIRTPPQPDPLSSLSELQSDREIEGETQMVDLGLAYQLRPSFWVSEMVDPTEFGVKAIFLVEFDIILGPIVKEFRVFNEQTEFSSVILDPTRLTGFYTMAVTRDQFKLVEENENIFVKITVFEDNGIQGETVTQNLLVIVTEKDEEKYDEKWVKHLIETLLVEWPDQQGYLAHQMDQFVPKGIELNIPALL